jgi:hypothetical protein
MVEKITGFDGDWDASVGGRSARELLAERLQNLPEPEFQLLASSLCSKHRSQTAGRRWLAAAGSLTSSSG